MFVTPSDMSSGDMQRVKSGQGLRTGVVPQRGNTYLRASEEQEVVETGAGNYDFITRMFGAFIPRKFGEFPRKSLVSIVIDKS